MMTMDHDKDRCVSTRGQHEEASINANISKAQSARGKGWHCQECHPWLTVPGSVLRFYNQT